MRNGLLIPYNSNQCRNMWCRSHQQASGAVEDTVYSTSRLKQTGKSSLWMTNCALFRRRRWLSLRRWMKFVCTPSIINTTMKTPYLLTTYSFKAGWCGGEGTRLPVMWPGSKSGRRPHMWGWVCCWFYHLLQEVFPRVLGFTPFLKNQHFQDIPTHPYRLYKIISPGKLL